MMVLGCKSPLFYLVLVATAAARVAAVTAGRLRVKASVDRGAFSLSPLANISSRNYSSAWKPEVISLGYHFSLVACQPGDGKVFPRVGDKLRVHYVGVLARDHSKFDSSRDRGTPFAFTVGVGEVIKGWDEGMMKMSLGERAILKVPAEKGYGAAGAAGGKIPPHADLYFDVELLAVNGQESRSHARASDTPEAPEQGFQGEDVAHRDMETCISDWGREYGPEMGEPGPCSDDPPSTSKPPTTPAPTTRPCTTTPPPPTSYKPLCTTTEPPPPPTTTAKSGTVRTATIYAAWVVITSAVLLPFSF